MSGQLPSKTRRHPASAAHGRRAAAVAAGVRARAAVCRKGRARLRATTCLTQCVVEDPGNLIYLQHFLANLAQKYGNNKTGARLAGLKIKSGRIGAGEGGRARASGARRSKAAVDALQGQSLGCDDAHGARRRLPADRQPGDGNLSAALGARRRPEGSGGQSPRRDRLRPDGPVRQRDRLLAARAAGQAARSKKRPRRSRS